MTRFHRRVVLAGSLAIVAATWAPATRAQDQKPIRVGSFLSLTGPASFLGEDARKAIELQIEALNAGSGIGGRKVEWVYYDDGGNAAQARTFATRLVDEEVDIIIGGSTTGTTMAAVPVIERAEIPFISAASGIQIVQPVNPWVFKTVASDDMIARRILEDVKSRGLSKVALFTETSGYGQSGQEQLKKVAADLGLEIVATETFAATDTSVSVQLTRVRNSNAADVAIGVGAGQAPAILIRNYRELGIKLPLYLAPGVASKEFLKIVGADGNGIRVPAAPLLGGGQLKSDNPVKAVVDEFSTAYERKWGATPSSFAGNAYDALRIAADAIKRAGSTDKKAVRDAIEKTANFPGVNGVFNMTPQNHTGTDYKTLVLWEIQNGNWVFVN